MGETRTNSIRDEGSVSYNAAIESAATADTDEQVSEFALRVQREADRRGFDSAKRRVILGDGAKWIWNMAYELFPGAIQIVDLYHAKGTVSQAAKDIFGTDSAVGVRKAKQWRDDVEAGAIDRILGDLELFRTSIPEAATCIKYLQTNRHRMRYPDFTNKDSAPQAGSSRPGASIDWGKTQMRRYALVPQRRECNHSAPLLPSKLPLR